MHAVALSAIQQCYKNRFIIQQITPAAGAQRLIKDLKLAVVVMIMQGTPADWVTQKMMLVKEGAG